MLSAFHLLNEALSTTSSSTKHQVKIAKISNFDDSFVCLSYQNMLIFHVWLSVRGIFLVIFFLMNWSVIIIKWPALFLIIPLLLKTTSSHINMGILISLWLLFTLSFHILAFNAYLFLKLVLIYSILLGLVVLQPLSAVAILLIFNLLVWFHLSLYIYMHITHTHIHMHTHTNIDMIYIYEKCWALAYLVARGWNNVSRNLELTISVRLADQSAPGPTCLCSYHALFSF